MRFSRTPARVWAFAGLWGLAVAALKWQQHASLQTQAMDLGVFTNVIWNTAHGRPFFNAIRGAGHLGDHFSPLLGLLSPLLAVWPDALALVVFQSFALALSFPAIYRLGRDAGLTARGAGLLALACGLSVPLHRVSRFDFHEVALGIPLILWGLVFFQARRWRPALACGLALLFLREDFGLFMAGWGAALALAAPDRKITGAAAASLGLCAAAAILFFVMPRFAKDGGSFAFSYGNLGASPGEAVLTLLRPWQWRVQGPDIWERVKTLGDIFIWTGGAVVFAPKLAPAWCVPLALQLLSGRPAQVRLESHYAATVWPFAAWAAALGSARLWDLMKKHLGGRQRAFSAALGCLVLWTAASLYGLPRYYRSVPAAKKEAFRELKGMVPSNAKIQAQANLLSHFAARPEVYLLPDSRPADWLVLDMSPAGLVMPAAFRDAAFRFSRDNAVSRVFGKEGLELYHFPGRTAP